MESGISELKNHQFTSLRKQMRPVYGQLLRNRDLPSAEKQLVLRNALREFFVRLREFRNLSVEEVATRSRMSLSEVVNFEADPSKFDGETAGRYAESCKASLELEVLDDHIREFVQPGMFESRRDLGLTVLRQTGILMPGLDLHSLSQPTASVLRISDFKSKSKT